MGFPHHIGWIEIKNRGGIAFYVREDTGAKLGWRRGGRPPIPFFENQKRFPDFGKKCPDCVHP